MWLLEQTVLDEMRAYSQGGAVTAADQAKYIAEYNALGESSQGPRLLNVAGSTAQINIVGTLTDAPSFLAAFFGGGNTVYSDIREAAAAAEANPAVEEIVANFIGLIKIKH